MGKGAMQGVIFSAALGKKWRFMEQRLMSSIAIAALLCSCGCGSDSGIEHVGRRSASEERSLVESDAAKGAVRHTWKDRVLVVARYEYGGELISQHTVCECGVASVYEPIYYGNYQEIDPEPYRSERILVPPDWAQSIIADGADLINDVGVDVMVSMTAWTDLTVERISVRDVDAAREISGYWHGAASQSEADVLAARETVLEVDPVHAASRLETNVRMTSYAVSVIESLRDYGDK